MKIIIYVDFQLFIILEKLKKRTYWFTKMVYLLPYLILKHKGFLQTSK